MTRVRAYVPELNFRARALGYDQAPDGCLTIHGRHVSTEALISEDITIINREIANENVDRKFNPDGTWRRE